MSVALADAIRFGFQLVPQQLAFHEIGHVLVADAIGRHVTRVSIDRADGSGHTLSEGPSSPLVLLLMSVAGDRAERLAPQFLSCLVDRGCTVDERDLDLALNLIASEPVQRAWVLEDARRQVDGFLLENRPRLDRLARQLLRQGNLDGHDVRRILHSDSTY